MDGITISDCKELLCGQTKAEYEMSACQIVTFELNHASLENMLINTISDSKMCFEVPLAEQAAIVTEDLNAFHVDNFSNKPQPSDKSLVFTAIKQTIEQLDSAGESVITIIVPDGISEKQPVLTSQVILDDRQSANEEIFDVENTFSKESSTADELLETEHSYCKQDFDRNHLWQTIAKLQSKIALLEVQENVTLSRLRSLETLIAQLRQENLLSDEKIKIIDSCLDSFDVAMVQ
ncbi:PREDICTED: THAP domain-containing protein 5 [Nanorana parkeri]|uniref:THAP domain-containing protein 5 n=1 Tax=Nanorana parkeri TaxID=125878 RepID=UPI0008548CEE|nr:PREDICTED: THAP domain-containing protein 5 [Nanorana parkeri]XP_018408041.1 PREDICTED: THAP domain-containing protein 5 [Nanorana parkeri]